MEGRNTKGIAQNDEKRCTQQRLRMLPNDIIIVLYKAHHHALVVVVKDSHQPHDKEGDHHQDEAPGDDLRDPCIGVVIQGHVKVVLVRVVG